VRTSPDSDCQTFVQESEGGDKLRMVFPATRLHFKTVSRNDIMRNHPSNMLDVFPHCAEALDILDKFLCLKLQSITRQGLGEAAAPNTKRIRDRAFSKEHFGGGHEDSARVSWHC